MLDISVAVSMILNLMLLMHKWLTCALVKTEIYFEKCVKRPQKSRFIFPYYEGTRISAEQMLRNESDDTGCELSYVTSAQMLNPGIGDNAELK